MDKSKFDLLEERKERKPRFFICDGCDRKIYVPQKTQKTITCFGCKQVYKLHKDFVSSKGVQIFFGS